MKKEIRVLLVDDHRLFRKALAMLINTFSFTSQLHEASNGKEAILFLSTSPVDVVLLDIQMPVMNGIETLSAIRNQTPQPKVIMLTQFLERTVMLSALRNGANGFLFKDCDPQELSAALMEVTTTGFYFNSPTLALYAEAIREDNSLNTKNITPREFQLLGLLKDGKSNKEVTGIMGLTLRTVESYRRDLIKKTNTRNTAELISFAYRSGLLSNP